MEAKVLEEQGEEELLTVLEQVPDAFAQIDRDVCEESHKKAKKTQEWVRMRTLKELKGFSQTFRLLTPVPEDIIKMVTKDPTKQREIREMGYVQAKEAQQTKMRRTVMRLVNASSKTENPHDPAVQQEDSRKTAHGSLDTILRGSAFDKDKIPLSPEPYIVERCTKPAELLPIVPAISLPVKHPSQLPPLRPATISTFTGRSPPSTISNESSEWTPSEADSVAQPASSSGEAEPMRSMHSLKACDPLAVDLRRSERRARIEPEFGGLEDRPRLEQSGERKVADLDGTDDSVGDLFREEQDGSPASGSISSPPSMRATVAPALTRDTSFSTRPSRAAARAASTAISASQQKGKGKGKGRGKGKSSSGATGSAPPHTASAPPPPPPPPPPRRSLGRSRGHNKTWGFTTGPNGPWIEPPVVVNPMFARPSFSKNLRMETKEVIAQLKAEHPDYDSHAPAVVTRQERMYEMRVLGAMGQWPTSNVRSAVDWEQVQKRRLGVAARAALKQMEEEEREEKLQRQRKARTMEMADRKRDSGDGSPRSKGQVMVTERGSGGAGPETAQASSDTDCVEVKSDEGEDKDVTVVEEHSQPDDKDDDDSLHSVDPDTIPRSFNEDFALRRSEEKLLSTRDLYTVPTNDTDCPSDSRAKYTGVKQPSSRKTDEAALGTGQKHDNSRRYADIPPSSYESFERILAYERDARRDRILRDLDNAQARVAESARFLAEYKARGRNLGLSDSLHENFGSTISTKAQSSASAAVTAPQAAPSPAAPSSRPDYTHPPPNASPRLREIAGYLLANMDTIASSDPRRATGDGGPLRMHDFEYDNLVGSGQIGGAADTRAARPARGLYVGVGEAAQNLEQHNARVMDLMERHLGLQLEIPPAAGAAFPAMTGEWPRIPAGWMENLDPLGRMRAPDAGDGGFGTYGEGPSGTGSGSAQHH